MMRPRFYTVETVHKIVRTWRQMIRETGREPTPDELTEKLGISPENIRKVLMNFEELILLENPYA
jgi:RNA polymerase primary sigma factor